MTRTIVAIVLALAASVAQAQQFSDWNVSAFEGGASAITKNDSGDEFGYVCFASDDSCLWVMALADIECEPEADYPVLVNAHSGASHMRLTCFIWGGGHFMVFKNYDEIQQVVNGNSRVGIAFPMIDGMFRVLRFSLSGALSATAGAEKLMSAGKSDSTRTQVL